jgi:2-haloacid dehalogenase
MLRAAGPHIGFTFDHVISVQEAGYFKPHWKTYAKAEEIVGSDRSSILFVANHAFD